MSIDLVLLLLALLCFALGALNRGGPINMVAAGLFCVTLTQVI